MKQNNRHIDREYIVFDCLNIQAYRGKLVETNRREETANPSKELSIVAKYNKMKSSRVQTKRIKLK